MNLLQILILVLLVGLVAFLAQLICMVGRLLEGQTVLLQGVAESLRLAHRQIPTEELLKMKTEGRTILTEEWEGIRAGHRKAHGPVE